MLQAYLDRELHPVEAIAIADHLDRCSSCWLDAADYRLLARALARLRTELDRWHLARLELAVEELIERGAAGTT